MRINCHTKKPDLNAFSLSTCQIVDCCGIFAFFYLNPGCVLAFCGREKDAGDLKNSGFCTEGLGWWSFMWLLFAPWARHRDDCVSLELGTSMGLVHFVFLLWGLFKIAGGGRMDFDKSSS